MPLFKQNKQFLGKIVKTMMLSKKTVLQIMERCVANQSQHRTIKALSETISSSFRMMRALALLKMVAVRN